MFTTIHCEIFTSNALRKDIPMKKKLFLLISAMVLIAFAGGLIINIIKDNTMKDSNVGERKINIVTTFYPIYLIGLNVADQIDFLEVKSLTQLNTGCLHDYQLTTEDMKLISNADMLIINGGGMESFIQDIRTNYPKLTIIDTTQGIAMLDNEAEHNHNEFEVDHNSYEVDNSVDHDTINEDNDKDVNKDINKETNKSKHDDGEENNHDHSIDHDHGEYNAHVWLDPELYIKQIETVRDGIIQYVNDNELEQGDNHTAFIRQVEENAGNYIDSVEGLNHEMKQFQKSEQLGKTKLSKLPKAVVFHDSFAYLANKVGIEIAHTIPLDSDTALSAGDIASIIDEVRQENIKYLFTEQQYSDSIAKQIAEETSAKVYIIDSVVTGTADKDSYLKAMRANIKVIEKAINEAAK